jgi:hypothetical protein
VQIRNEGVTTGIAKGSADTLLRLLSRRFGADAARAVETRIRAAGKADLDRFAERILDVATIDEVFVG